MAKLVDARDLKSLGKPYGFDSRRPHHVDFVRKIENITARVAKYKNALGPTFGRIVAVLSRAVCPAGSIIR